MTLYADSLEDMVCTLISEKLETLKGSRKKVSTDNSNRINLLKNRIGAVKISQERLVNMLLNDEIGGDMISLLNEKAKKLSDEQKELSERIDALENEGSEIVNVINLSKKWKTAGYDKKKAVCNILIHKILIREDGTCEVVWNI